MSQRKFKYNTSKEGNEGRIYSDETMNSASNCEEEQIGFISFLDKKKISWHKAVREEKDHCEWLKKKIAKIPMSVIDFNEFNYFITIIVISYLAFASTPV